MVATHLDRRQEEDEDRGSHREVDIRHRGYCGGMRRPPSTAPTLWKHRERRGRERRIERPSASRSRRLVAHACASRKGWLGAPWLRTRARTIAHGGVQATRESMSVTSGNVRGVSKGSRARHVRSAGRCRALLDGPYVHAGQIDVRFPGGARAKVSARAPDLMKR